MIQDYKIYINDTEIDIDTVNYPIRLSIADINNLDSRNAFKSGVIKVPATEHNKATFDFLEDVNIDHTTIGIEGRLEVGNIELKGQIVIYDTVTTKIGTYYQFQILSGNGDWVKLIEGDLVSDLGLSLDHTYTKANINDSETAGGDYVYPLINYGVFSASDGAAVDIHDRLPAVKIQSIVEKIYNTVDYSVESTFLNTADFAKYFMTFPKNAEIYTEEFREENMFESSIVNYTYSCTGTTAYCQSIAANGTNVALNLFDNNTADNKKVIFNNDSAGDNFDNGSNFNISTNRYTLDADGSYKFEVSLRVDIRWDHEIENIDLTAITCEIIKNGATTVATTTDTLSCVGCIPRTHVALLECNSNFQHFVDTDYFEVKLTITGECDNTSAVTSQNIWINDLSGYFKNDLLLRPAKNYPWTTSELLPDILQVDYVKAVVHLFNLILISVEREKKIYIEEYDSFYGTTLLDWASKLSEKEEIKILKRDVPTWINYQMKIDGNDSQIINYKQEVKFSNGTGESLESENGFFAASLEDECREIGLTSVTIPKLWNKKEAYPNIPEQSVNFLPRILKFEGRQSLPTGEEWTFDSDTMTTYPQFDALNFSDFITYYTDFHYRLNNSHVKTARMYLNDVDIANIIYNIAGFQRKIWLDEGSYILNKVSYTYKKAASVELIQRRLTKTGVTTTEKEITETGSSGSGGGGGTGTSTTTTCLVSDSSVISEITLDANWSSGNYIGSTSGLSECDYYIDYSEKIKYEFDGTNLVRFYINVVS